MNEIDSDPTSEPAIGGGHVVWYVAAGYRLPAGIEAYLLHYATELRNHGFDTRIVVFEPLPRKRHRYLQALHDRGIPIQSLYARCRLPVLARFVVCFLPWCLHRAIIQGQLPRPSCLHAWLMKRSGVRLLSRMIREEQPDIVHVKGRLITEAWGVFPASRTVYQHALMGTVDPSWAPLEVEGFRRFANDIARVLVQSPSIAETMAGEFRINRPIDTVFTMAPDERGTHEPGSSGHGSGQVRNAPARSPSAADSTADRDCGAGRAGTGLRFGILCRFTEQKGLKYILGALVGFRDRHGGVDFTFAGMGPLVGMIREFVREKDLHDVRIVPVSSPPDVLSEMDVFVHPGLDDAMPVSIVEALMCGVPCIGSNVGGVPDLVRDGVEGLIVEPASSGQILEAMERFASLSAPELLAFRRRARSRYEEKCTPAKVGAIVAAHYRAIIADARKKIPEEREP